MFTFTVQKRLGEARLSTLTTPHGAIIGPFFQFVATQAAIRGMVYSEDLEKLGVSVVLSNTYHLHLRPGEETVAAADDLHGFMQWPGPITTDSGGYQVFSLGQHVALDADGVTFRSPLNG
ncbi:MAG: tRNA-guanine transglycosylase, partial [Candidatus Andersenbacteria bacterium]